MRTNEEMRFDQRKEGILNEYFDWMYDMICDGKYSKGKSWRMLFRFLHETEFVYILELDGNRADDGIDLRYRFAYDRGYSYNEIEHTIGELPCSVLEMMIALSRRCEDIADNTNYGDRTGKWFFEMVESLGLIHMNDGPKFDKIIVSEVLEKFMARKHRKDGRGGLFTVSDSSCDMREEEIWDQLMRYLNSTINKEI